MNQYGHFGVDTDEIISHHTVVDPSEWRLLRRLHLPDRFNDPSGAAVRRALVVDVEATGLSTEIDDVIQLALLPFDYELHTGRVTTVHKELAFEGLREPCVPISEEAILVTGITDDMVKGQSIDAGIVDKLVSEADLVIAHNAKFDRPMVEKHWGCFAEKPWACTLKSIDWLQEGFGAGKLDYLGMQFGWFFDGHQALADCEACLALLAQQLPKSGTRVISAVREAALHKEYLVRAIDSPFDLKDTLKQRGYQWRGPELPNGRVWWTMTREPEKEFAWLSKEIYGTEVSFLAPEINAFNRFTDRVWHFET
jgi:DNA polymerase-3 subunit epsilon